jgi:hypothetical protein
VFVEVLSQSWGCTPTVFLESRQVRVPVSPDLLACPVALLAAIGVTTTPQGPIPLVETGDVFDALEGSPRLVWRGTRHARAQ